MNEGGEPAGSPSVVCCGMMHTAPMCLNGASETSVMDSWLWDCVGRWWRKMEGTKPG